jgi:ubiquitin-protein ligase
MIGFTCAGCGRSFTVPDSFAGRQAKCKSCGAPVTVPLPSEQRAVAAVGALATGGPVPGVAPAGGADPADGIPGIPGIPAPRKIPMRQRRLSADAAQMAAAFKDFPLIRIVSTRGEPPEVYQVEYNVRGLERDKKNKPVPRERHLVEIQLTSEYPRSSPKCKMLTPVFHPNIDPATICVGDHWTAGERLVDLVIRIGEMLAFQAYNIKSPLDGEAAMWADLHQSELPIDSRAMRPPGLE